MTADSRWPGRTRHDVPIVESAQLVSERTDRLLRERPTTQIGMRDCRAKLVPPNRERRRRTLDRILGLPDGSTIVLNRKQVEAMVARIRPIHR